MNRHPLPDQVGGKPLFSEARGDIAVSFEFFPPKTEKMAETLWELVQTLAPLQPRFVSVTYGAGGSTRERTHQTVERILKETSLTPARAPNLRGRQPRRNRRDRQANIGSSGCATSSPFAAMRPRPARNTSRIPRLSRCGRAGRRPEEGRAVRHLGRRLSRNPSGFSDRGRSTSRISSEGRCRRRPGDHAVLLLGRLLLPFPRRGGGGGNRRRDRSGHPAGLERRDDPPLRGQLRRRDPRVAGRSVRRSRRPSGRAPADRRDRRGRAVRQLYAGGVRHFHFYTLNRAELFLRDLPPARREGPGDSHERFPDLPRRSRQAHPDQGRRLRHRHPGRETVGDAYSRRARSDEGPEGQQRPSQHHPAPGRPLDLRALRRGGRRNPRHQHVQREPHQPGRLRRRASGRATSTARRPASSARSPTATRRRTAGRAGSPERSARPTRPCRCRRTSTTPPIARSISTR